VLSTLVLPPENITYPQFKVRRTLRKQEWGQDDLKKGLNKPYKTRGCENRLYQKYKAVKKWGFETSNLRF